MHLTFVLYDYYPFGGLQEDCLATAKAVQSRGHEVSLITRTWKGEKAEGIDLHLLGKRGLSNISRNQHFFEDLERRFAKMRTDGIIAFNRIPKANIYFAADPCYAERSLHYSFWKKMGLRHRHYSKLEAQLFSNPNLEVLTLTRREIDAFIKHYDLQERQFHLLPPGIGRSNYNAEADESTRTLLRAEIGTKQDAKVALFVGSGFRIKGLDRALHAIKANQKTHPDLEFWIVGNGKRSEFQKLAQQTDIPIRFIGGRADVARFYQAADFLLHPAYSESAGKVLLEALSYGLPVLTTDTCGYAPHILKAKAGHVINSPYHQDKLDQALKEFINDDVSLNKWKANAISYTRSEDLYSCHQAAAEKIEAILCRK